MARLNRTIRRENEAAIAPDGSKGAGVGRPQGSLLVADPLQPSDKIDRNAATAPSINAGAVACEMAVLS